MSHVNTTGIAEGGAGSVHALFSRQLWLSLSDSWFLPKSHTVHLPQDTPHLGLGAFPGSGSFIVPGARVLAERPPHADPVTGRCRERKLAAAGSAERLRQPAGSVSGSVCVECLPTS